MEAGRARRTAARGGTQAALNPPAVPAASSPPPAITGTRPDAGRRRSACHFELVLTASAPAPLTCGGVGVFLAASGAGNLAGPAPRRRRGEMRGGRGVQPLPLKGHIPRRAAGRPSRRVAASAVAPLSREAGGSSSPGGLSPRWEAPFSVRKGRGRG
uniref:Uncharacterized protein n=1 Tax=Myotis myotis TaxID=51298 RepID=A0A7J7VI94_MYOMY|nr:hypothetical protein mMyoMyo1_008375 [Myotis myotis]